MRKNVQALLAAATFLVAVEGRAASIEPRCATLSYPRTTTTVTTYRLDVVAGHAVFSAPGQQWESGSVNGLCVALFRESDERLAAAVATDARGDFTVPELTPGRYALVAALSGLHEISVPIEVVRDVAAFANRRLLLHMRLLEDSREGFISTVRNNPLRLELLRMVERDQELRNALIAAGSDRSDPALTERIAADSAAFASRLDEIVAKYGWPVSDLAGVDGTQAAFLIVQHASLPLRQKMLPFVREAFRSGELPGESYALLLDRVLVGEGKKKIYGTQPKPMDQWKGSESIFEPIENEAEIDKRRAELGLPPMAEYGEFLRRMYFPPRPTRPPN